MSRYIDIEPYEKDGWYLQKNYHDTYGAGVKTTPLFSIPTANPIKHGEWIKRGDNSWECSVCHEISCCNGNYCVDCGAQMDEVGNEAE